MAYKIKSKKLKKEEPYAEPKEKASLSGFTGTEAYHEGYMGVKLTDGSYYVGTNNASWLITDICSVLKVEPKVSKEEFVSVKFKVNADNTAEAIYEDGNGKELYRQKYKYTDFKKHFNEEEVQFFFTDNVLMLSGEY